MHIHRVRLKSYKSFRETDWLTLSPGRTALVGPNNAGKTAFLEALSGAAGQPHRSPRAVPAVGAPPAPTKLDVEFRLALDEVRGVLSKPGLTFALPGRERAAQSWEHFLSRLPESLEITASTTGFDTSAAELMPAADAFWTLYHVNQDGGLQHSGFAHGTNNHAISGIVGAYARSQIYRFLAERLSIGQCAHGTSPELRSDAANLAEVLTCLQSNASRLLKYSALVRRVLPSVSKVSTRPVDNHTDQVLVWHGDLDSERIDLAFPLTDCGSGVGQVLAMMYIIATAETPKVLLIDEPNTFLHPGAVSALLEIFREHPQHQYVVTTHSPAVITGLVPERTYLLSHRDWETEVTELKATEVDQQRAILAEVGASLADVFGPRQILWVEGPSDQIILCAIAEHRRIPIADTAILPIVNTGDFESKHARLAAEVYRGLGGGIGLIPPACAFVLDREGRTDEQCERLAEKLGAPVHFLPRTMIENYFLDAALLSKWIGSFSGPGEASVVPSEQQIEDWLTSHAHEFGAKSARESDPGGWVKAVHGAKVLQALAGNFSENRHQYDKVRDAALLVKLAIETGAGALDELAEFLQARVDEGRSRLAR